MYALRRARQVHSVPVHLILLEFEKRASAAELLLIPTGNSEETLWTTQWRRLWLTLFC